MNLKQDKFKNSDLDTPWSSFRRSKAMWGTLKADWGAEGENRKRADP